MSTIGRRKLFYIAAGFATGMLGLVARDYFSQDKFRPAKFREPTVAPSTEITPVLVSAEELAWEDIKTRFQMPDLLPVATLRWVIDGEKFAAEIDGTLRRVRLIATDAPESELDEHSVECGFVESKRSLEHLLGSHVIRVQRDEDEKDGKDRYWAHVWLEDRESGDTFLANSAQMFFGYAAFRRESQNLLYGSVYSDAFAFASTNLSGVLNNCSGFHDVIARIGSENNLANLRSRIQVRGVEATIEDSRLESIVDDSDDDIMSEKRYEFLVVIRNVRESGDFEFKRDRFSLISTEGKATRPDSDWDSSMETVNLQSGESIDGMVSFTLPAEMIPQSLRFMVEDDYGLYWSVE